LIYCDKSNYYEDAKGKPWNRLIGSIIDLAAYDIVKTCYDPSVTPGSQIELPMGITSPSHGLDGTGYANALATWKAGGSIGAAPDITPFIIPRPYKPNTIDLCTWYLTQTKAAKFYKIDKSTMDRTQDPTFISTLSGNDKPINHLSESLAGTLLHEVSFLCSFPNPWYSRICLFLGFTILEISGIEADHSTYEY
jgi:hypothetical protein